MTARKQKTKEYSIIIEAGASPDYLEMRSDFTLAKYFSSNITFLKSGQSPMADVYIERLHQNWEIKSIFGNGKNTIHHRLSCIEKQSYNIVINLYRSSMKPQVAIGRIKKELKGATRIKKLLLITKSDKVIAIK